MKFDAGDINELCRRSVFPEWPDTIKMLPPQHGKVWIRREIEKAQINITISQIDSDYSGFAYYTEYIAACELALVILQSIEITARLTVLSNPAQMIDVIALKSNTDIVAVAERYTTLIKSGKNFVGVCPFHSEKHGSFFVYPDNQSWHCFGACNTGGDVISLVMKAENCDFKNAVSRLGGNGS